MSDRIDFSSIDPTADAERFDKRVAEIARLAAQRGVRPTLAMQLAALWRLALPASAVVALAIWGVSLWRPQPRAAEDASYALLAWAQRGDAATTSALLMSLEGANED